MPRSPWPTLATAAALHAGLLSAAFGAPGAPAPAPAASAASQPAATPSQPAAHAKPAAPAFNAQDRQFVQGFGAGGQVAMDGASIAIIRAQDPRVRAYAQQATHDWTVADAQLASLARRAGIAMPSGNDPARLAKRQRLDPNPALPFDFAYLGFEIDDHRQHAALIQAEMTGGANAGLRSFAASKWPLVLQQDQQARAVAQAMGAQVTAPPLTNSPLTTPAVAMAPAPVPMPMPAPQATPQAPMVINAQDRQFVQSLGSGGLSEIDAATLATTRARDPQVRIYAQQVAQERAAVNAQLAGLAAKAGLAMPGAIDARHLAKRQRLDAAGPVQFDFVYLNGEVDDHQETIQWLEAERTLGQAPSLRAFAASTLPVVMQHMQLARGLAVQVAGGITPGLAAVITDTRALRK
jgi:putative membrane protein